MLKTCKKCGETKDYSFFYGKNREGRLRAGKAGLSSHCKDCMRAKQALYRKEDPMRSRDIELRCKFGSDFGLAAFNSMFLEQNGCCAICGIHQSKLDRTLAVDHCHTTLEIRGLLCTHCNHGIGKFRDNIATLQSAISYLQKSRSKKEAKVLDLKGEYLG